MAEYDKNLEYIRQTQAITALAKNDVNILMEDDRFAKFKKGKKYRCLLKVDKAVLMDENKTGFICDMAQFEENFEFA